MKLSHMDPIDVDYIASVLAAAFYEMDVWDELSARKRAIFQSQAGAALRAIEIGETCR